MHIEVTKTAREKIKDTEPAGSVLRVNGELVGGCGMNVEYSLVWDEPGSADRLTGLDGLSIAVDPETEQFIGASQLKIDYVEQQGFKLITPGEILAYGLRLRERWS
ncbi:iron-sulfur cluster biosynthesis family protein [Brevibacillus sp. B_LB10_24]|uniref:iron-sulfur cluster biosynthesis family protein n=1 Tax=Brevibacillus sp. B_LB10_24 TaxID=3380645 RepID=UPI0038BB5D84